MAFLSARLSLILLLSMVITGSLPHTANALPTTTTLGLLSQTYHSANIINPTIVKGSILVLDVQAVNLPPIVNLTSGGVNGFDISVRYDPAILKATAISFDHLNLPSCASPLCLFDLPSPPVIAFVNSLNSTTGTAHLALVSLNGPTPPYNRATGTGTLFRIQFEVAGTGFTPVYVQQNVSSLTGVVQGAPGGIASVPYTTIDGSFDNRPPFALSASPSFTMVEPGKGFFTTVTVTRVNQNAKVNLTAVDLPTSATFSFNPPNGTVSSASGMGTFNSTLKINITSSTPNGIYTIGIVGFVPGKPSSFNYRLNFSLIVGVRDIAVTAIVAPPFVVNQGDDVSIGIAVQNKGSVAETFPTQVLANQTLVASTIVSLSSEETKLFSLIWKTGAFVPGSYTITVKLPFLQSESNTSDNTASAGPVTIRPHTTTTSIKCQANSATLSSYTCAATVTDNSVIGATAPTGTVSFTSNNLGTFASSQCTLSPLNTTASTCSTTYTTSSSRSGAHKINGTYPGDRSHSSDSGFFDISPPAGVPPAPSILGSPVIQAGIAILLIAAVLFLLYQRVRRLKRSSRR